VSVTELPRDQRQDLASGSEAPVSSTLISFLSSDFLVVILGADFSPAALVVADAFSTLGLPDVRGAVEDPPSESSMRAHLDHSEGGELHAEDP